MATKHYVNVLWCGEKHTVVPATVEVYPGDTIVFFSLDSKAKISFPDSGVVDIDCWVTIEKGERFEAIVNPEFDDGDYYYSVMCEHEKGFWYGEGNSCPRMIVKR